jgi:hypothetical protein
MEEAEIGQEGEALVAVLAEGGAGGARGQEAGARDQVGMAVGG